MLMPFEVMERDEDFVSRNARDTEHTMMRGPTCRRLGF